MVNRCGLAEAPRQQKESDHSAKAESSFGVIGFAIRITGDIAQAASGLKEDAVKSDGGEDLWQRGLMKFRLMTIREVQCRADPHDLSQELTTVPATTCKECISKMLFSAERFRNPSKNGSQPPAISTIETRAVFRAPKARPH